MKNSSISFNSIIDDAERLLAVNQVAPRIDLETDPYREGKELFVLN